MSKNREFNRLPGDTREFLYCLRDHLDDHALIDADPQLLKSTLYPLLPSIRINHIATHLARARATGMVRLSRGIDGRAVLHFPGCEQTKKRVMVSEHVAPDKQCELLVPAEPKTKPPPTHRGREGRKEELIDHSLASKLLKEGGLGETARRSGPAIELLDGKRPRSWTPFRTPTAREAEVLLLCREVLAGQWQPSSTFWGNRVMGSQKVTANLNKVERVMREVQSAVTASLVKTTPGQYAMDCWKRFAE